MKTGKKPLLFTLALLPAAAAAGLFTALYQLELYGEEFLSQLIASLGSKEVVLWITVLQTMLYAAVCGFLGYILAEKCGLIQPFCLGKTALRRTLLLSMIAGLLFSLDYWTFGAWIPGIREAAAGGMTLYGWLASVLYGGVIEEVMMRLFLMSLFSWGIWKLFFRGEKERPAKAAVAANIAAALLFAAGHLPATAVLFGTLSPLILVRCFLLNGGFGLLFGHLYQKYGIGYAMLSHALVHIVSKGIWAVTL